MSSTEPSKLAWRLMLRDWLLSPRDQKQGGLQASCSAFNQKTNPEQLGQTEIKGTHIEKQEVKLPVFKGDTILQT